MPKTNVEKKMGVFRGHEAGSTQGHIIYNVHDTVYSALGQGFPPFSGRGPDSKPQSSPQVKDNTEQMEIYF